VWQGIKGTLMLAGIVALVAFPLGIAAAVYLEEYAGDTRFARVVNVNIRNLAGVPSIVYGLLGLAIFVQFFGLGRTVWRAASPSRRWSSRS
jgi:phosphate transport system permease protein